MCSAVRADAHETEPFARPPHRWNARRVSLKAKDSSKVKMFSARPGLSLGDERKG